MKLPPADWLTGYVTTAITLAGSVVGAVRWRELSRGLRVAVFWLGASTLADLGTYAAARITHNVQVIGAIWTVTSVVLAMEALGSWQGSQRRMKGFRIVAGIYAIIWIFLAIRVEALNHLSTYAQSLGGVVVLGASVVTMVRRAARSRADLLSDPAFLVAAAFAAVAIPDAFQAVIAEIWQNRHSGMVTAYFAVNNLISGLSALLIVTTLREPVSPHTGQFA